jgi:hypothetical protein
MRRLGWSATARLAALSAVLLVTFGGTAGAMEPATAPAVPPALCALNSYKVIKGSGAILGEQRSFDHGPAWRVEALSDGQAGTLSLTRVVTTTNTWSVTGGAKGKIGESEISATVGFSVSETEGFNAMRSINIPAEPPGRKVWFLEAGTKDTIHTFKVQTYNCSGEASGAPLTGRAIERGSLIYRSGTYDGPA